MLKHLRWLCAAALLSLAPVLASAATLLPNGEQTFLDANGAPLAGGKVYFYIPGTQTAKTTWRDSGGTTPNANPVVLDAAGRAIIYGSGSYQQLVQDSLGNTIWNQLTADSSASGSSFGGTSTGSANAQVVQAGGFTSSDGQSITFVAGFTNTSSMTVTPSGGSAIPVVKDTLFGPTAFTGGEIFLGNVVTVVYSAASGNFNLVTPPYAPGFGPQVTIASAATTNIGAVAGNNIVISGSVGITSFGTAASLASPVFLISFTGAPLLTNSAALALPGGVNLQITTGQTVFAIAVSAGWKVLSEVASFNGRVGVVVPTTGDYTLAQTTAASTLTAPSAGQLGETISLTGTAVSLTNNTATNVTGITLTAGHWRCSANSSQINTTQATTSARTSISLSSGVEGLPAGISGVSFPANNTMSFTPPDLIVRTTALQAVFLVDFNGATGGATGTGTLTCQRTD